MSDMHSQLTDQLHHFHDSKTEQIKSDWFNKVQGNIISVESVKQKALEWFGSSKRNTLHNLDALPNVDLTYGCTDYINNFLAKEKRYQVLEKEYSYYALMGKQKTKVEDLEDNVPVIVSLPNWFYGNTRPDWETLLACCGKKAIDIHIDSAWFTASKELDIDLSHPNIKSIAFSITKTGFEWNKFGIRLSKQRTMDSITIRNTKPWINRNVINCANFIMDRIDIDYAWNTYEGKYNKLCEELGLTKTNFIHVAKKDGKNVGVANILSKQ